MWSSLNVKKSLYPVGLLFLWGLLFFPGCMTYNAATGRNEFIVLTTPVEVMLGQAIDAQLRTSLSIEDNAAAQARLERIGRRVAQVSERQDYAYHFSLVKDDALNAFTTPGGNIYFNTGLFNKLSSDDEIAGVLAHEIGHCSARHVAKKYQAALGVDLLSGAVLGRVDNELTRRVAAMGVTALTTVALAAYSRQDEFEADRIGVKYMVLAGYNPHGMVNTFEVLAAADSGREEGWAVLRSHPRIQDRILAVEKEIEVVQVKY
jgi:predicted Zn-dependent protease